jgi:hypothetical protein
MGWPLRGIPIETNMPSQIELIQESRLYPNTLDSLRRAAQQFGILHSYHTKPTDVDNDFFFRIGMVDNPESVDPLLKARLHNVLQQSISMLPPLIIEMHLSDLCVAFYQSEELPRGSTDVVNLMDSILNGALIKSKY